MSSQNVQDLLSGAVAEGSLSSGSMQTLTNLGVLNQIQAGLGTPFSDMDATEGVIIAMLIDDSGSIGDYGNIDAVRKGHNEVIDALKGGKSRDGIQVSTGLLNGGVLSSYIPLDQAVLLDTRNYNPAGGTPLHAQAVVALGAVAAKLQDAANNGNNCRAVVLMVSDGEDNASGHVTAAHVAQLARDLLSTERCIILAMGFSGGVDFSTVFQSMGVLPHCILTANDDAKSIRRAFRTASQSAARASQSAAGYSQVAKGGFAGSQAATP